jgi:hypothetical protein
LCKDFIIRRVSIIGRWPRSLHQSVLRRSMPFDVGCGFGAPEDIKLAMGSGYFIALIAGC